MSYFTSPFAILRSLFSTCLLLFSLPLFAAYGYFGDCASFITVSSTFYEAAACSSSGAPAINGVNLGIVPTLTIDYIEQQSWENSGDDVFNGSLYYRIWTGTPGGAFTPLPMTSTDLLGGGNEKRYESPGLDVLSGLAAGTTYTFEFYYSSDVNWNGGGGDVIFESNGGANYQFAFTTNAPAPVELKHFLVRQKQDFIALQWQTSSEINSSHFDIEKSKDGSVWKSIGRQRSEGTYGGERNYRFLDEQAIRGKFFYRLNMVDFDGQQEYSQVEVVDFRIRESIKVFPNPVKDRLHFQVGIYEQESIQVEIYTAMGQLLQTNGTREVQSFFIETTPWNPGIYSYRLIDENGETIAQDRFVKN